MDRVSGIEYEADPGQFETLVQDLGLEHCESVASPAVNARAKPVNSNRLIENNKITHVRAFAARGDYLAVDRPECQFGAKELLVHRVPDQVHGIFRRAERHLCCSVHGDDLVLQPKMIKRRAPKTGLSDGQGLGH